MAFEWKQIGKWALWLGTVTHLVLGITLLSGFGGDLISSFLGLGLAGWFTIQGVIGALGLWYLWMTR